MTYRRSFLIKTDTGFEVKTNHTAFWYADLNECCLLLADLLLIEPEVLRSKAQKSEVAMARHIMCYILRKHTKHTLKKIGNWFGGRDHTTVINSVGVANDMIDTDRDFRNEVRTIEVQFLSRAGKIQINNPKESRLTSRANSWANRMSERKMLGL